MREYTVPPLAKVDPAANLADAIWTSAQTDPNHVVLVRPGRPGEPEHVDVTAAQFHDQVGTAAKGLIANGVQPGDRVGLMSRTRFEWMLFDAAIWAAGGVTVPVYETSSVDQTQWILADSGTVGCIVETAQLAATVQQAREQLPQLRHVWQIEADPGAQASLAQAGTHVSDEELHHRRTVRKADDLATIIYTSGTTGRPKGCELTHRNFLSAVGNAVAHFYRECNASARILFFLPLAHVLAREVEVCAMVARAKNAFSPDVNTLLDDLAKFSPTTVVAVPRVFEKLYNGAKQKAYATGKRRIFDAAERVAIAYSQALDTGGPGIALSLKHALFDRLVYRKLRAVLGGQCRSVISGGAPLGARLAHFFRGVGVTVYEGWGLTETTAAATVNRRDELKIGTVGRPLGGTSIRIADDGEVLVKGEIVMAGYWQDAVGTTAVLDSDGWLHTGDLGSLDDEGFLTITGRKKEIIVTAGGKNVAPALLEDRLRAHALISQCMVVGDKQPFIGCLITLDTDMLQAWKIEHNKAAETTPDQLRDDPDLRDAIQAAITDANKAVSRAESIKVFRILPTDFTVANGLLTPSLKVKREKVAIEFADEIAAIYSK